MELQVKSAIDQHTNHFKKFLHRLVEKFQPLQLFYFAKTNILTECGGCFSTEDNSFNCNYCLLMVTSASTRIDHEVQEFARVYYNHGTVTVITHSHDVVLAAINANNRFFMTVCTCGQLLYSHNGMTHFDFNIKFDPSQSVQKAQKHFDHRIRLAEGFFRGAAECYSNEDFNVCTFMLHQVVEQCCIMLIRVHLAYRSEIHNLLRMLRLCGSFSDKPLKAFLSGSPQDEALFQVLLKSYSDSRYGNNFFVSGHDAQLLLQRVSSFVVLAREMCLSKIDELSSIALLDGTLNESEAPVTN